MEKTKSKKEIWSTSLDEIFIALGSSREGLLENSLKEKERAYGKNIFGRREKKSAIGIFLKQFASPLIFILIGAGLITLLLGEWVETIVIAGAVLVSVGLGFYREYHAENTLEKLASFIKDRTRVVRGGKEIEVDSDDIYPGDIIKLSYGARVPADARIVSANNARLNESILTGESVAVEKREGKSPDYASIGERFNMVHAGTLVVDGFLTALVVGTGDNTEIGKIAGLVSHTERAKTPIQKGLTKVSWIIFALVIFIVIWIFVLGFMRGEPFFEMMMISVAVAVGAVPEALPIALTVILSIGAERIAKKKGITRTLLAAETLGSTTLIMTDKTGTLTEANMKLVGIYSDKELLSGKVNEGYDDEDKNILERSLANVDVLIENPGDAKKEWEFKGKPFEVNIVKTARDLGLSMDFLKNEESNHIILPFNSTNKFSVAVASVGDFSVMGAPDILIKRSSLSPGEQEKINEWINKASHEGKRLIALGRMKKKSDSVKAEDVNQIEFLGIMAFHDPVREAVPRAIKKIEALGTKIVMITGDLKGTAMAVAREIGWDIDEDNVLTGQDLQIISDEHLLERLPNIKIFARVTPEDKLRVGTLYRRLGEVVAMTGDGVNDAPALKAMDIGVSLGSGSDVAKSVADLVLLDDNFEIITSAIEEGRRILTNIRKTFVYLMSNSLDGVFVIGGALVVGIAFPLTALQIIWVNLFTGSLPAIAFAYDEDFDHERMQKGKRVTIFTKEIKILTFGVGALTSILLFVMYYFLLKFGMDLDVARTIFFLCFGSYVLVVAYSFRSLHKPIFSYPTFSNTRLNQSVLIAGALLVMTVTVPFFQNLFKIAPLPFSWLWLVIAWLVFNVALVEFAKWCFRKAGNK